MADTSAVDLDVQLRILQQAAATPAKFQFHPRSQFTQYLGGRSLLQASGFQSSETCELPANLQQLVNAGSGSGPGGLRDDVMSLVAAGVQQARAVLSGIQAQSQRTSTPMDAAAVRAMWPMCLCEGFATAALRHYRAAHAAQAGLRLRLAHLRPASELPDTGEPLLTDAEVSAVQGQPGYVLLSEWLGPAWAMLLLAECSRAQREARTVRPAEFTQAAADLAPGRASVERTVCTETGGVTLLAPGTAMLSLPAWADLWSSLQDIPRELQRGPSAPALSELWPGAVHVVRCTAESPDQLALQHSLALPASVWTAAHGDSGTPCGDVLGVYCASAPSVAPSVVLRPVQAGRQSTVTVELAEDTLLLARVADWDGRLAHASTECTLVVFHLLHIPASAPTLASAS